MTMRTRTRTAWSVRRLQPQVDAVKTSVEQLRGAVGTAKANPTPASLAAARNTLQGVRATIANLRTVVAATC